MDIKDLKFEQSDFAGQDIASLPDRPSEGGIDATALKDAFDNIGKNMLALGNFNDLIDALTSVANGDSGADNIGVTPIKAGGSDELQTVLEELQADKVDTVAGERLLTTQEGIDIGLNTADRHNHTNKAVLDAITSAVKGDYDALVVLLTGIVAVSNAVANKSDEIPTSKAIVDYVTQMGGGDMAKTVYDPDGEERNIFSVFSTLSDGLVPSPLSVTGKRLTDSGVWDDNQKVITVQTATTWAGSGPYTQDIVVSGMTAADYPDYDIDLTGVDFADIDDFEGMFWQIYDLVTDTDKITLYSKEPISEELDIILKVVK